jgi:hypothetical protein
MWHPEPGEVLARSGVVCCSPATIQEAMKLNSKKEAFQATIKSIRECTNGKKTRIDKLIDRVLQQEGIRTKELEIALNRANLNRLDILRCYAKIRVMPKNLQSISWTWARTHSVIDPISREDAIKEAHALQNPETRDIVLSLLARLPPGEMLAYKKELPNQLRANLVWKEDGCIKRKAVTISGVVLSQDEILPKHVWRDDPGELDSDAPLGRLKRLDARIDPEPYIKALHLHLYTGGSHAK